MSALALGPFVVADHFVDHEADELLAEVRIEVRVLGQLAQAGYLAFLAAGVGGGQVGLRLVFAHGLGDPEPLCEHMDQRGVDVVDAGAEAGENRIDRRGVLSHRTAR